MAKYSQEFKLKVVEHYLSGHGDSVTGQIFNVHRSDVQKWSKAFKLICAELAGDFHLGYARQLTDKSSLLFDLAF
jgi:hypothetical protein